MNILDRQTRAKVISCLIEGNSTRGTSRLTGVVRNTVSKLLVDLGNATWKFQDKTLRNLPCKRIQCDELWSYVYAKDQNLPKEKKGKRQYGDIWVWVALCADTRLVVSWRVGKRDERDAYFFMHDLKARLSERVQITTDGHRAYLSAVESAFGTMVDYAMLSKLHEEDDTKGSRHRRYIGSKKTVISGCPDPKHISTSYVERQNLTLRMNNRRLARKTNAYSKKLEHHKHMLNIFYMCYNFCRIHETLRVTPAMEAGIADHVWGLDEVAGLLD